MDFENIIKIYFFNLGIASINEVPDVCYDLPKLENPESDSLNEFINSLCEDKPFRPTIQIIK